MGIFVQSCPFPVQIGGCGFIYPDEEIRSEARSLFCYWAFRELGIRGTHLLKRLGMSQLGVVRAVNKGEKELKRRITNWSFNLLIYQ